MNDSLVIKPVRIFIIQTLTSALFMAAYYKQEKMRDEKYRDICVIPYSKICNTDNQEFIVACKNITRFISEEIITFAEQDIYYVPMSFKNLGQYRQKKKKYLTVIKEMCEKNNIRIGLIKEIYHSNRAFHQYFKYLNPKSKLIGFEHGLSDTRCFLLQDNAINIIKNIVKCVMGGIFFIFYSYLENDDLNVSLLAPEIRKINKKINIKYLYPKQIIEIANKIVYDDLNDTGFFNEHKSIGIIINSDGFSLAQKREDRLKFHRDFAVYILEKIKGLYPEVKTIIFKTRSFDHILDKDFSDVKEDLVKLFNGYKVFFFDEITKTNYPPEFYINIIRPKFIFGDVSSGLFYSKALMPEIATYDYNEYVSNYEFKHFGATLPDYKWLNDIFFKRFRVIFKDILPKRTF
ncbi:MAG: hypothetical protein NTW18_00730 [Candidatus Omnitrophica bacterium]|nr:hypothetical protein [Candidatus Omnitrophota bacterium]